MSVPHATVGAKRNVSNELKPGESWLGATQPDGSKFLGWVLVQVWEQGKGDNITVNWSGDRKALFKRAADRLAKDASATDL